MNIFSNSQAAKLREAVLGVEHEETTRSLDYMTSIYADLGKQEYAGEQRCFKIVQLIVFSSSSMILLSSSTATSFSIPPQNHSRNSNVQRKTHLSHPTLMKRFHNPRTRLSVSLKNLRASTERCAYLCSSLPSWSSLPSVSLLPSLPTPTAN